MTQSTKKNNEKLGSQTTCVLHPFPSSSRRYHFLRRNQGHKGAQYQNVRQKADWKLFDLICLFFHRVCQIDDQRVDIITFYNKVFVKNLKSYILKFGNQKIQKVVVCCNNDKKSINPLKSPLKDITVNPLKNYNVKFIMGSPMLMPKEGRGSSGQQIRNLDALKNEIKKGKQPPLQDNPYQDRQTNINRFYDHLRVIGEK